MTNQDNAPAPGGDSREAAIQKFIKATMNVDWQQFALNRGGCCHVEDDGRLCGRAFGWAGHQESANHLYVPLYAAVTNAVLQAREDERLALRAAPQANESTAAAGGLDRVLADVREERSRQEAKWGPQDHPFPLWLTILSEEVGEASREFLHAAHEDREHGDEHATKLRKELVQAAAVAVQIIEVGDRKQWWPDHRGTTPETP